jgi:hypothetical protein
VSICTQFRANPKESVGRLARASEFPRRREGLISGRRVRRVFDSQGADLSSGTQPELLENLGDVVGGGVFGDRELSGHLVVGEATGDEGPSGASSRRRCPQCAMWTCPAMDMRRSAVNASRHTPSTTSAARTGEGRRW